MTRNRNFPHLRNSSTATLTCSERSSSSYSASRSSGPSSADCSRRGNRRGIEKKQDRHNRRRHPWRLGHRAHNHHRHHPNRSMGHGRPTIRVACNNQHQSDTSGRRLHAENKHRLGVEKTGPVENRRPDQRRSGLLGEHRRKGFHEHGYGSERTAGFRGKPHERVRSHHSRPEPPDRNTPYEGLQSRRGFRGLAEQRPALRIRNHPRLHSQP